MPAATGPRSPSRTDAGRPAPSPEKRSGAIRRRCGDLAWSKQFFWDGRAPSLEAQVRMLIEAADESNT